MHGDERRIVASGCGDHGDLTSNEISCERRQPIQLSLRPVIFDRDVLTIHVTGLVQATAESRHLWSERLRRLPVQESDHRHCRLLRARRERPCRRTAEQRDERAPLHCLMPPVLSTDRIAHLGTAGDCCAAAFQSSLFRFSVACPLPQVWTKWTALKGWHT